MFFMLLDYVMYLENNELDYYDQRFFFLTKQDDFLLLFPFYVFAWVIATES